ncbi:MAG TPA: F0F1 ATP synthase subunit B [Thermoanaerobaculia bacterium]|nr:F0F1 ATP synthase subunit B [Thermoanaerobaculia bacterium]
MRRAPQLLGAAVLLAAAALRAAPALAAEAAEHAGHGAEADTYLGLPRWAFLLLNLVVFIALLAKAAGPAVVRFLEGKQQEIGHQLAEARRQREEAAQMEGRIQGQIAELRREVEELAERSQREGERERQEILAEAERERQRLELAARAEIEQGLQQARQQLTAHAARLAADLAEQRLESGLSREDRKRLFRDNLARLERKQGA